MTEPVICFGQQPCGFFPKRFFHAKVVTALRLMLVDDQVNEAEAIVSGMRNAGVAVRPLRPAGRRRLLRLWFVRRCAALQEP